METSSYQLRILVKHSQFVQKLKQTRNNSYRHTKHAPMSHRFDDQPVKDRFSGVSFQFYTDEEIEKLSVQKIVNERAFDNLNEPTKQGLHDKRLGVSPFDHKSTCPTCGLTVNYCPGHVGHIELTAPLYNPFMMKDAYKLLKSKCFNCHRLRIHQHKIDIYVVVLKLLKAGDLTVHQDVKSGLQPTAYQGPTDNQLTDPKKLTEMKRQLEALYPVGTKKREKIDKLDLPGYFTKLHHAVEEKREVHGEGIDEAVAMIITSPGPMQFNTTVQKRVSGLIKEIWSQVVTTTCPHCKKKSPAVKRDGFTKLFVKPLAARVALVQKQAKNIQTAGKSRDSSTSRERQTRATSEEDKALEQSTQITGASTSKGHSRKQSATTEPLADADASEGQTDVNAGSESDEDESSEEEYKEGGSQKYITPLEVEDHVRRLWGTESALLGLMYGRFASEAANQTDTQGFQQFFIRKVIVPPNRFRPESEGGFGGGQGDKTYLHTHSAMLLKVIQRNVTLGEALVEQRAAQQQDDTRRAAASNATSKWIQLQDAVNTFMDSSMAQKTADKAQPGVRQLLERKEGMFRMKMMGKRVNFGGRSVISPDPNITTDQIGVPVFMAKKLTFPESVAPVNVDYLRRLVKNGALVHPGANFVEDEETGISVSLQLMPEDEREGVANQLLIGRKVVHRHLHDGDALLVNRQPTLHKPSIMAHLARILPKEQTIRMHYANCSTYNADFDGDEMNIHLPQSYHAASEAYQLMATHKQYVLPTHGKPIRGLIQDSVVSGVFLTSKDTFLTRDEYMQLVYAGLRELIEENKLQRVQTLAPTVLKPRALWTGKQVITTVLKNIVISGMTRKEVERQKTVCGMNVDGKSRLPAKEWGALGKEEGEVVIRDNEHLQGALDKNQFGASDQGMVHSFYEIYGSKKAGELLTALARIFALYLQGHGFTVGLDDLVLKPAFNKERRLTIEREHVNGLVAAAKYAEVAGPRIPKMNYSNRIVFQSEGKKDRDIEKLNRMALPENPFEEKKCIQIDDPIRCEIEQKIGQSTSNMEDLEKEFDNVIKATMSQSTSTVLKDCIPEGLIKRFPKNNISAMVLTGAKGGLVNQTMISAILGQQELEGRRVPRMQNGKTLPCYLPYDPNPRASGYVSDRFISGLRPQDFFFHCMSGREGLIDTAVKTSRSGYLQRCLIKQLESLVVSYDQTVRDNDGGIVQFLYGDDSVDVMQRGFLDKFKFLESNCMDSAQKAQKFVQSGAVEIEPIVQEKKRVRRAAKKLLSTGCDLSAEDAKLKVSEPAIGKFHPLRYFGAISEKMESQLRRFIKKDSLSKRQETDGELAPKRRFPIIDPEALQQTYYMKYLKSVVHPGENVGTIAAQSIGEPSTQMTLNTFHLAGHGGANMTLGIPRLKEILMTTPTNIKTPSMTVYFNKKSQLSDDKMTQLANSFLKLRFTQVVQKVNLAQSIDRGVDGNYKRVYKLTLHFEDAKMMKEKLGIKFSKLCKIFSERFVPKLMDLTLRDLRKASEQDMGGINVASSEKNALSQVKTVTTKATKVARGTEQPKADDADQMVDEENDANQDKKKESDEEDEEEGSADIHMDIDGNKKKVFTEYEGDSQSEAGSDAKQNVNPEQGDLIEDADQKVEPETTSKSDPNQYKKLNREKHSKYLQFIKGDFDFVKNESASITLQFPLEYKKLLMLTLSETALNNVLVSAVKDIEKCSLIKKEGAEPYLFVQGINFEAFEKHPELFDLPRMKTNHSYALKLRYGVEACRANIVKEIREVFDVYGIGVDYRHLSLIADFVTYNGDYRAFNRIGMEESSSPFLKMSYETTMKYLVQSSTSKDTDWITSPSSALVLGLVPTLGTNSFDLIHDTIVNEEDQ